MNRIQFHGGRTVFWVLNLPLAVVLKDTWLLTYLALLSVCALIESSATDFDQALTAKQQARAIADEVSARRDSNPRPTA